MVQQFYTNATIVASFKEYVRTLLGHVNPYTNLTYAADPTIFAYESGNELVGPVFGDMDVPVEWLQNIASFLKELAPEKLFVDGTYGVNRSHLRVDEVDIFSDHFYPVNITKLKGDLDLGEFNWSLLFLGRVRTTTWTRKCLHYDSCIHEQELLCR